MLVRSIMPFAHEFLRAEEFDPDRCIAIATHGQCRMKALPGIKYCVIHGRGALAAKSKKDHRMYVLGKLQAEFEQFRTDPEVKGLRSEIALCRVVMNSILRECEQDENGIKINHNRIMDVTRVLEKLISSCDRIEARNNTLLDKENIITICNVMVNVVKEYVKSPDDLEQISAKMIYGIAHVAETQSYGETVPPKQPPVDQAFASELAAGLDESECDESE